MDIEGSVDLEFLTKSLENLNLELENASKSNQQQNVQLIDRLISEKEAILKELAQAREKLAILRHNLETYSQGLIQTYTLPEDINMK
jgi:hypothetical protein